MKYIYRITYSTENYDTWVVYGNEYIPIGYYTSFDKVIKELQTLVDLYPNQLLIMNYPRVWSGLSLYDVSSGWIHRYYVEKILLDHDSDHWSLHQVEPLYYRIK